MARVEDQRARAQHLRLQLKDEAVRWAGIRESSYPKGKFETDGFLAIYTGPVSKGTGVHIINQPGAAICKRPKGAS
eukprot:5521302-Pyramimonas_sp.AAC.1